MRNKRLFIRGDAAIIFLASLFIVPFVLGAVLVLIGINNGVLFQIGTAMAIFGVIVYVVIIIIHIFTPSKAILSADKITITTFFDKQLKTKKWNELQNIRIKILVKPSPRGDSRDKFICLYFANGETISDLLDDYLQMEDIFIIAATKKNKRVLMEFLPEQFKSKLDEDSVSLKKIL